MHRTYNCTHYTTDIVQMQQEIISLLTESGLSLLASPLIISFHQCSCLYFWSLNFLDSLPELTQNHRMILRSTIIYSNFKTYGEIGDHQANQCVDEQGSLLHSPEKRKICLTNKLSTDADWYSSGTCTLMLQLYTGALHAGWQGPEISIEPSQYVCQHLRIAHYMLAKNFMQQSYHIVFYLLHLLVFFLELDITLCRAANTLFHQPKLTMLHFNNYTRTLIIMKQ